MRESGRTLDEFLRAWWLVNRPYAARERLTADEVAAIVAEAAVASPPPLTAEWRAAEHRPGDGYAGWEAVVLSQIADLADFADQGPLDKYAYFGIDAPRPDGCVRATGVRWYNFDPRTYLECGMAGALGGWEPEDGIRAAVPGPSIPLKGNPPREAETLAWSDLTDLAWCGQDYE